LRQIRSQYDDFAVGDSYVGLNLTDTGNHQRPVADNQVEWLGLPIVIHHVDALSYIGISNARSRQGATYGKSSCDIAERATSRPSLNTYSRDGCNRSASCTEGASTTTRSAGMPGAIP
jgi:hypothetical protein